jgi:ribosomal protein L37AE/L43A
MKEKKVKEIDVDVISLIDPTETGKCPKCKNKSIRVFFGVAVCEECDYRQDLYQLRKNLFSKSVKEEG